MVWLAVGQANVVRVRPAPRRESTDFDKPATNSFVAGAKGNLPFILRISKPTQAAAPTLGLSRAGVRSVAARQNVGSRSVWNQWPT